MSRVNTFIPIDRRYALLTDTILPDRTHGAALFADISGFTPLTGALAQEFGRRRGAEEVLNYINPVYEAIIADLHRYGGSVISFAGDAITCWFDDALPDENVPGVERATECAFAMQEAMQQFTTVQTPAGTTVELGIKVAVAAGPARRFVIGDPDVQYIDVLAGDTLQRMAGAESVAERGEVTLSQEVVAILGDGVTVAEWRTNKEGKEVAVATALPLAVPETPWPDMDIDALPADHVKSWALAPVYERLQAGGFFLGELRPTVALFMRFSGLDYDNDDDAPVKMDVFIRWVQQTMTRYEGFLTQLSVGDKGSFCYVAFGAPIAHDDDAVRTVATALDLRARATTFDGIDVVQIGVSMGRMWSGAVGSKSRITYGVMGNNTNMAARLMGKAEPGQVLVRNRVVRATEMHYHFNDLGAIQVKGRDEPLPVAEAVARRHGATGEWALLNTPLIGRTEPLAQLNAAWIDVQGQAGRIVRLVGDAGMGKSHLAAQFNQQVNTVAISACQSIARGDAYYPWRQLINTLLDLPTEDEDAAIAQLTEWVMTQQPGWALRLPLLGDLLGLPIPDNATTAALDAATRQKALFTLVVEMVQAWTETEPLLLVIENAHWLDEASSALTENVAQAIASERAMLLVAHRPIPEGEPPLLPALDDLPGYVEIGLEQMDMANVASLIADRLGAPSTALLLTVIQKMAFGNPFFVGELLDTMRQSDQLVKRDEGDWDLVDTVRTTLQAADFLEQQDGEWRLKPDSNLATVKLGIPDSIHGIILSRLDRLPESHKLTLKVSSVIGHYFELYVVAQVHPDQTDVPTVQGQAREMESREIVREDLEYRIAYSFRHHSTQEVAYETLLFAQRRQLHRSIAQVLVAQEPDAIIPIAHHAFLGKDWPLSLQYQLLTGSRAKQLFANQQGIEFFQKALQSAQQLPESETVDERLDIHLNLGELLVSTAQYDVAVEHLDTALALAQDSGDWLAEAHVCRWYGRSHELRGEYPLALTWLERGFDAVSGNASAEEAEISLIAGLINIRQGDYDRCLELCDRSLEVADALDDAAVRARTFNLMGIVDRRRGDSNAAIGRFEQSLAQYETLGDVYGQATSHNLIANGLYMQGRWTESDEHYRQSLQMFTQIGDRYNQVLVNNNLGGIAREQGRLDAALGYYEKAVRLLEQSGGSLWVLGALNMNTANALIQRRELDAAGQRLQLARDYFDRAQLRDLLPEMYGLLAEAAWLQSNLDDAQLHGQHALDLARELKMPHEEGHNLRILGEIARAQGANDLAETHFQNALTISQNAGDEYEAAKIELSLADLYASQGRADAAGQMLDHCEAAFERFGAQLDLEKTRTLRHGNR